MKRRSRCAPVGGVGRFTEDVAGGGGGGVTVSTPGGGGVLAAGYGVRNWLDASVELAAAGFTQATYDDARVMVQGVPASGRVSRSSRVMQLRAGGTLRLGTGWVPTVYLGLGLSARMPTAATLQRDGRGEIVDLTPDGMAADLQLDGCAVVRVGLDHRVNRRWSVGLAADASRTLGVRASPLDVVSAGLSLAYTWYPGWW
jgi:hypothetical protein